MGEQIWFNGCWMVEWCLVLLNGCTVFMCLWFAVNLRRGRLLGCSCVCNLMSTMHIIFNLLHMHNLLENHEQLSKKIHSRGVFIMFHINTF